MENQPRTHTGNSSQASLDPRGNRDKEKSQAERINCLEVRLRESDKAYVTTKDTLDHYWCKSIKAEEKVKKLEAELQKQSEKMINLRETLEEKTQQNEELQNLSKQLKTSVKEMTESELLAKVELSKNDEKVKVLKADIDKLKSEKKYESRQDRKKLKEKDDEISKLESEVRSLRSEKRWINDKLEEKTNLERKLNRNIRENVRTIEKLSSDIDVLIADEKQTSQAKDHKILQLESALESFRKTHKQLEEKNEGLVKELDKASADSDERGQLLVDLGKVLREQESQINKYKEEHRSILELVKKLGISVKMKVAEGASLVELLSGLLVPIQRRFSLLEQCFNTFKQFENGLSHKDKESVTPTCSKNLLPGIFPVGSEPDSGNILKLKCDFDAVAVKREHVVDKSDLEYEVPAKKFKDPEASMMAATNVKCDNITAITTVSSDEEVDIES